MIEELRILPPLAIARFGAAPTPMDNYDVVVDPEQPLGYRDLRPALTLRVDPESGEITETFMPADPISFTEGELVRPVAPFLEVWALTDGGKLEQLTMQMLGDEGASPSDVRWRVHVANHKAARRTAETDDRIEADSDDFSDHAQHLLNGRCVNFWPDKAIPFGRAQYIKPTAAHPEIRLRFTPGPGHVYGASLERPVGPPDDPNIVDVVYDGNRGDWLGYTDHEPRVPSTEPYLIYRYDPDDRNRRSVGYLDDGCDGIVRVTLDLAGKTLSAYARVGAGPPTYVPDAVPIRTVADELEQALFGIDVLPGPATPEQAEEILRRAFETVRLMNTTEMNAGVNSMAGFADGFYGRTGPIMAPSLVDGIAVENLHQSLLAALRSGTAPWFADALRRPEQIGDLSDRGRRKMPAMMRGSDGRHLTLTLRQIEVIRKLMRGSVFPDRDDQGGSP